MTVGFASLLTLSGKSKRVSRTVSSFEIASWDDSHASWDVFRISSVCSANQSDGSQLVDWTTALLQVNSHREVLCQYIAAVTEL